MGGHIILHKLLIAMSVFSAMTIGSSAVVAGIGEGAVAFGKGDYATALREFRVLAEQGDAEAQYLLGGMYDEGYGVNKSDKEALKWWLMAAEQGHAQAQNNLGTGYFDGRGVIQDYEEAAKWWQLAAEQ